MCAGWKPISIVNNCENSACWRKGKEAFVAEWIPPLPHGMFKGTCSQLSLTGSGYTYLRNCSISIEQELTVFDEPNEHLQPRIYKYKFFKSLLKVS